MVIPSEYTLSLYKDLGTYINIGPDQHTHVLLDIALQYFGVRSNLTFIEIGALQGSTAILMTSRPNTRVYSIDTPSSKEYNTNFTSYNINPKTTACEYIQGSSHDSSIITRIKDRGLNAHILFLNGDLSTDGILMDFNFYSEYVLPGGFVVINRYDTLEAKEAIGNLKKTHHRETWEFWGQPINTLKAFPAHNTHYNSFILRKKFLS